MRILLSDHLQLSRVDCTCEQMLTEFILNVQVVTALLSIFSVHGLDAHGRDLLAAMFHQWGSIRALNRLIILHFTSLIRTSGFHSAASQVFSHERVLSLTTMDS
jgi:hypothetical protein